MMTYPTIYRAMCYSTHESMPRSPGEVVVFIQAVNRLGGRVGVEDRFRRLLAEVWGVPADTVDMYNISDEEELFKQSADETGITGDMRFFESGSQGNTPTYNSDLPLLLVRPDAHERLMAAWAKLPARDPLAS